MDPSTLSRAHGAYTLSDDPARLDLVAIHAYLRRAYWSEQIPFDVVERAVRGSLCIGAYDAKGAQVGLARFISDYATFCWVCDVYVLEEHRGRGLSKGMMGMALAHPRLQGLRRWGLVTLDAQGLYRQFGFDTSPNPERMLERVVKDLYRQMADAESSIE